jgi:hypothetical protein
MEGLGKITLNIALIACLGFGTKSNPVKEKQAIEAALTWLALVDQEQYDASWDEAASYFQGAVSQQQWLQSMESFRKPLGQNLSRKVKSKQYHTSLPGAPDGEYVVIQFVSSFSHKKSAIETVTPMLETEGKWRVSGYYIK